MYFSLPSFIICSNDLEVLAMLIIGSHYLLLSVLTIYNLWTRFIIRRND